MNRLYYFLRVRNAFLTPSKVEIFAFNRLSSNTVKILSAKFKSTIRDMFLVKLDLFRKNCQTNGICAHERNVLTRLHRILTIKGLQNAMGSDSLSLMVRILCSLVRTLPLIKDWGLTVHHDFPIALMSLWRHLDGGDRNFTHKDKSQWKIHNLWNKTTYNQSF